MFNEETIGDSRITFVIDKEGVVRHIVQDAQSMEQHAEESLEVIKNLRPPDPSVSLVCSGLVEKREIYG